MSSTAEDYEITPANTACANAINKTVIVSTPGSPAHNTQTNFNAMQAQHVEDSKYDSAELNVQPLYGGKNNIIYKKYNISFRKKMYTITENDEISALKKFFKNKMYKRDYLLTISNNNKTSTYIIRVGNPGTPVGNPGSPTTPPFKKRNLKFINITELI
jgi:hypothetical protein